MHAQEAFPPGELVGSGRSADVFEYGEREVLRRYRDPRDTELEVAAMEYVRARGFPVPAARALSPTDIVMDRVSGSTMLADLARRPWLVPTHAATLATLHERLHTIDAPDWLPTPLGRGGQMLHMDLHPENVILSDHGPIVIDWPNAASGPGEADIAHTWIVLACAAVPGGLYRRTVSAAGRSFFLSRFLRHFDRAQIEGQLAATGAYRLRDRTLPDTEREALERLFAERD